MANNLDFLDSVGEKKDTLKLEGVGEVVAKYAGLLQSLMIGKLNEGNANASFELQNSIYFRLTKEGIVYGFEMRMLDYWKFVEEGVQGAGANNQNSTSPFRFKTLTPSKSHIKAIEQWMVFKSISAFPKMSTLQTAQVIARSIKKKGTKPLFFVRDSVEGSLEDFKRDLKKALGFDVLVDVKRAVE